MNWEELFEEISGELHHRECLYSHRDLQHVLNLIEELKVELVLTTNKNVRELSE